MLDLRQSSRPLQTFQQRFLDDGLPVTLSRQAFAAFDPGRYAPTEVERGRRSWTLRAMDEYRSLVAFTGLLDDIAQLRLPFDGLGTAVRIVRDEHRHVELCRRLVVALGGDSQLEGEPVWVRRHARRLPRERLLRMVVGSLCIGETLSVRFLAAVRDATTDPIAREVATCLVADEAIHGRFGWTMLENLLPGLSARERRFVAGLLPRLFEEAERAFVPAGARDARTGTAPRPSPFGSLPPGARAALFDDAFARDVVARFEALGIPAEAAARRARRPSLWARLLS